MKRILLASLFAMILSGNIDAQQYIGTYKTPNKLITFKEKHESKGGVLEQPGLAWVGKQENVTLDRAGKMKKFSITQKMKGDGWEIRQGSDNNNEMKFTLCLDKNRFLPGGLDDKGWGPQHTGNVVYMDNMACFDLMFTKQ